ncbi:MAG TPA: TIGR00282 family metallophosphoesterase [Patescibacteria group bacterium]|nr:TIGR00282 family metallophosphoesterase [Patescibacteria group bacterium]
MPKVLLLGDIFGKPGRQAVARVLPSLREEYGLDLIVANVENLAHGKGVTPRTLAELKAMGIDVFTSGNHVFDRGGQYEECFERFPELIRPANYETLGPGTIVPGYGYIRVEKNGQQYLVINLGGRVFFEKQFKGTIANPFLTADKVITQEAQNGDIIIVDFHAEATSEKLALGHYLDGRVSAVVGTHTHVPSADTRVMPSGTFFQADLGMTGVQHSAIGATFESVMDIFLDKKEKFKMEVAEGECVVNGLFINFETKELQRLQKMVDL